MVNKIGQLGGFLAYYLLRRDRTLMVRELSKLLGRTSSLTQKEIEKIARKGFHVFIKRQMENLYWGRLNADLIERIVSIEGREHLDGVLSKGRGAILVTAHFGSLLLPPFALGFKGYRVNQIAGPPLVEKQRLVHRKIFALRAKESERLPLKFIVIGSSMRPVFNLLKNNEILFIAFDGREANNMVPVDFFGHAAYFSPGPFKLSLATKAPILPAFIVRRSDDTHRLIIGPPFELEWADDKEKMLEVNTAKFAKIFEGYIAKYPCHYAMTLMRMEALIQEGALKSSLYRNSPEANKETLLV